MYQIINSEKLAECRGVLKLNLLDKFLEKKKGDNYYCSPDKYKYIIDLMMKFRLCYEIDDQTVLIPELMKLQEPDIRFDYTDSFKFLLEYDYLPGSIIPQFIVRMYKDIKNELHWRYGVVLENGTLGCTAVIRADEKNKKILIYVNGKQKCEYFAIILSTFRRINASFKKLSVIEKVLIPDDSGIAVSYDHLIRLEKMGVKEYIPDGSEKKYNVKELLGKSNFKRNIFRIIRF